MNRQKFAAGKIKTHESLSLETMKAKIYFDIDHIVVAKWIDEMPSRHRDAAITVVKKVYEKFKGKKATPFYLEAFIDEVHKELNEEA